MQITEVKHQVYNTLNKSYLHVHKCIRYSDTPLRSCIDRAVPDAGS